MKHLGKYQVFGVKSIAKSLIEEDFGLMLGFGQSKELLEIQTLKDWNWLGKSEHQHYLYYDLHTWYNVIARC
jgi:hypothetical protein